MLSEKKEGALGERRNSGQPSFYIRKPNVVKKDCFFNSETEIVSGIKNDKYLTKYRKNCCSLSKSEV